MTADWNWFFSTLSQSTAAIVGIIGAFIIAKIFSNQATFTEKNNKLKTLVVEAEKILDKIDTIDFDWYNEEKNSAAFHNASREINKIDHEDPSLITDEMLLTIYDDARFSIFTEKATILEKLREEIVLVCQVNQDRRLREEAADRAREEAASGRNIGFAQINALLGSISDYSIPTSRTHLSLPSLSTPWDAMTQERELITECHLEAKHHARSVGEFLESVKGNPESPPQITWSLILVALIFLAGVIYPLTFMPATAAPTFELTGSELFNALASVKGALISILAIAFSVVFFMFTRTNISMKYAKSDVEKLEKLTSVNNYCAHFKFLAPSPESEN